jgi:lipoate-protein ligase A
VRFLDLTLPSLAENLALDEALLLAAEAGESGEVLRFWGWPKLAVVLGAGGVVADDVDVAACQADGLSLARRSSGGGTVLLGPGCLLFSLVLDMEPVPELHQIGTSYRHILGRIATGLAGIQSGVEPAGISDLAINGCKFSGNSQQRKRRYLLHHGTLLHGFDVAIVGHYLRLPPRRPDYRGDRSHAAFLMNLPDCPAEIQTQLRQEWGAFEALPGWPAERVRRLVQEKYGRDDWTHRR